MTSKGTEPASEKWTSIKDIDIQFGKMTSRIEQALISNNVDATKLITQLRAISVVKNKKVPLFDDEVFEKIQSVDMLWRKLSSFWNIFDYELLECVIEISECGEARSILKNFLSRIDPSAIEDANLVLYYEKQNLKGQLKPVLRVKVNTEKCTLKIKEKVKKIISKAFNLDKYALCFRSIKKGCIELFYYISKPLKSHLLSFKISEDTIAEFLADEIISLQIDERKLKIPSNVTDTTVSR